jgi:hypothetical protein
VKSCKGYVLVEIASAKFSGELCFDRNGLVSEVPAKDRSVGWFANSLEILNLIGIPAKRLGAPCSELLSLFMLSIRTVSV